MFCVRVEPNYSRNFSKQQKGFSARDKINNRILFIVPKWEKNRFLNRFFNQSVTQF